MIKSTISERATQRHAEAHVKIPEMLQIDLVPMVYRHFGKIALAVLACWALGIVYYVIASPEYESTAEILLEPKNETAATGNLDSSSVIRTLSDDSMASHLAMIQSTRLINEGLKRDSLSNLPSLVGEMTSKHRSPAEYIQEKLSVTRGGSGASRKANTLKLRLRHSNAEDCKLLLDAIVKNFQLFVEEKFADDKERLVATITKAQTINKEELAAANDAYRTFRQEAPLLWNGHESTNVPRMLYEQIETELNALQLKKTELESRLSVVVAQLVEIDARGEQTPEEKKLSDIERMALIDAGSAERVGIFLEVFAGGAMSAEFQSDQPLRMSAAQTEAAGLMELRQRQQRLQLEYGAQHPDVQALKLQIAEMERFVSEKKAQTSFSQADSLIEPKILVNAYVRLLRNDLTDIDAKQRELRLQSEQAKKQARELVNAELEGELLKEKADDLRSLYDATIDKLRDVHLAASYGGLISETLESAEIGEPVWPKLGTILILSTLFGLAMGGGGAALMEFRNRSLRTAQEIERISDLPILSQIPSLNLITDKDYLVAHRKSGSRLDPALCTVHDSKSREAEVFRGLRTVLFFKSVEEKAKTIAVTSANSGDGKSLLCGNLAISIAQAGRKVLLMECDLRQPAVAKLFDSGEGLGISDVLDQKLELRKAVKHTDVKNLDLLSAGTLPLNPAELLASNRFADLIASVEKDYDFIILDCPPVLAVADPCIISAVADAVLVVVRLNPQSRVELRRTIDMLNEVDASTLGVVVNASSLEDEVGGNRRNSYMVAYGYGTNGVKANGYYHSKPSAPSHHGK